MLPSYSSREDLTKPTTKTKQQTHSIFMLDQMNTSNSSIEKSSNLAVRRIRPAANSTPTQRDFRFRTLLLIGLLVSQSIAVVGTFISIVVNLNRYVPADHYGAYQDIIGYLIIFTIATIFEIYIAIDSVWNQNAPQLVALCLFEALMCGFGTILPRQITKVIKDQLSQDRVKFLVWRFYLVPSIMFFTALVMLWLTWFVANDFGWQTYKKLGANRELRKAMIIKSIFFMLQKFNFFCLIGFCVLLVQLRKDDQGILHALDIFLPSLALAIPFLVQFCASIAVELELPFFLFLYGIFWCIAMLFMVYEIIKLHPLAKLTSYQHSLFLFSTVTVLLLFSTGVMSIFCFRNFHKGLKEADSSSILRFFRNKINLRRSSKKLNNMNEDSTVNRVVLD